MLCRNNMWKIWVLGTVLYLRSGIGGSGTWFQDVMGS